MRSYAVLIDAGFLKRKLGSQRQPMTADHVKAFVDAIRDQEQLKELNLHRVYFYDAPPLETAVKKPLQGGKLNFSNTPLARANQSLHAGLARVPYAALRLGDLAFRGWRLSHDKLNHNGDSVQIASGDLSPNIQQKGVDMRIGLDIASLTLKQHVQIIVLVTGDSDFVPAMKFARREGAQVFLVRLGHRVTDPVLEHADLVLELHPDDIQRRLEQPPDDTLG